MAYLVEFSTRAARDLEALYLEKNVAESLAADRWFNGLERCVATLSRNPYRCPLISELKKSTTEMRHLLYGRKPHVYRIIYTVDESRQVVVVLHVRHGARRRMKLSDIES